MPCADVEVRFDAFVDSEMSPSEQIDVARHLAECPPCERHVRSLLALRERITGIAERAVGSMSFADVWPRVAAAVEAHDRTRTWRRPRLAMRAAPMWAAGMAMAAGALLTLRALQPDPGGIASPRVAAAQRSPVIERVAGDVDVRRDLETGATIILVNHPGEAASQ